jgi:hypothetical protein
LARELCPKLDENYQSIKAAAYEWVEKSPMTKEPNPNQIPRSKDQIPARPSAATQQSDSSERAPTTHKDGFAAG